MTTGDDARPVVVLYTGGTFGMVPTDSGLAPHPHLHEQVAGLVGDRASAPWSYAETPRAIDSAEASYAVFGELVDQVRGLVAERNPRAVVVIHGTDSMAYSAAFAAFALADLAVPVVFTGSQLPLGAPDSDAPGNFRFAFESAAGGLEQGVSIAFDGRLLPAVRATKRSSSDPFGFHVAKGGAAAGDPLPAPLAEALRAAAGQPVPAVGLVKVSPGLGARMLAAALQEAPGGLVLESYGAGTAPVRGNGLGEPLRAAAERGQAVVAVTQCAHGGVDLGRYAVGADLADLGVTGGGDLTTEAALGKLAALGRAGLAGDDLRRALAANLVGELGAEFAEVEPIT
jgi:L-asparaginase